MINTEIPKNYTASPSSYASTPHLTINAEAVADLDSSNAFEGPEKLLEVWFSPSPFNLPERTAPDGLKSVPASTWEEMLDLVNCKVLSILKSDQVDAYLLSESSMFVFPHKLILKTCGTTTLLCGLPKILEIAGAVAGFPHVVGDLKAGIATAATPYRVFYSRKNFLFPDKQKGPHRSWRDEVTSLDRIFRRGSAYMIGKMNGEHWYLYLTEPNTILTPPASPDSSKTHTKYLEVPLAQAEQFCLGIDPLCQSDETLEILMTDLDQNNAKHFYLDHASAVAKSRYFQQVDEKRAELYSHNLTDSGIDIAEADKAECYEDVPDVFGNVYSEDGEFVALNGDYPFPQELTTEGHALGTVVSENSGLADVYPKSKYPQAQIDAYLFTPCGFSANGVIPAPDGHSSTHYFTVHVTPEPNCSYASFETNVPCRQSGRETKEIVEQMVNIFKPGRFSVTLFETKEGVSDAAGVHGLDDKRVLEPRKKAMIAGMDNIEGYRRIERIVHDLDEYDLVFRYYERWDWAGGEPRLGEVF